jgi:uncharacterized protein YegJ (DUF2314 family)
MELGNTGFVNHHEKEKQREEWQANNHDTHIEDGDWCQMGFREAEVIEYLWVKVLSPAPDNNTFLGYVDNDPVFIKALVKHGTSVMFTRNEIMNHIKKDEL